MQRIKFSKVALLKLAATGGTARYGDTEIKDLFFVVSPAGGQKFKLIKKFEGRKLIVTLGAFPNMTVEKARTAALDSLDLMRKGINPNVEKKARKDRHLDGFSYADLFSIFKADFQVRIRAGERRLKSLQDAESIFTLHANPLFYQRDLRQLTSDDARRIVSKLKTSKTTAVSNKTLSQIKSLFNFGKRECLLPENHFAVFKKFAEQPRERVISEVEEAKLLAALDDEPQIYKDIVQIALMTGQRKYCVLSMRWDEIDPQLGIWSIPASKAKSKKGLVVPLIPSAMEILRRRSQEAETGEPFVFPNKRSQLGHVVEKTGKGSFWRRVTMRAGLYSEDKASRLTFHDLRRSTATRMARAGIELAVIQKALGHSSIAITQRTYAHHDLSQVRAGLEHISNAPISDLDSLKAKVKGLTAEQLKELLEDF